MVSWNYLKQWFSVVRLMNANVPFWLNYWDPLHHTFDIINDTNKYNKLFRNSLLSFCDCHSCCVVSITYSHLCSQNNCTFLGLQRSSPFGRRIIPLKLYQCHGCWCPGSLYKQTWYLLCSIILNDETGEHVTVQWHKHVEYVLKYFMNWIVVVNLCLLNLRDTFRHL